MHIQETSLPLRVQNALMRSGYRHVEDVLKLTEQQLLELPGFGENCYTEWLMWCRRLGIIKKGGKDERFQLH